MKKTIFTLFILFNVKTILLAQDTTTIEEKASLYYNDLKTRYGQQSAKYSEEYNTTHGLNAGIPPDPLKGSPYFRYFYRKERDSLANLAYKKADCLEGAISYLEERLQIWELMKGGLLPDSTFTVLMDAFYDIAPEQAIDFCVEHWAFSKLLERQSFEVGEGYNLRNYPYVQFLFDNLDRPQLIHVVLTHVGPEIKTEQNQTHLLFNPQSLAELVIQSLRGRMSREDFDEIIRFVQAYVRIHDGADLNQNFISKIEKIADGRKK